MELKWDTRTRMLLGEAACDRLRTAHVAIVGLGGVGSYTAEALARAGVGSLTLMDSDVVEPSNLNRQLVALHSTLGCPKAEIMAARVRDIHPQAKVTPLVVRYGPETRDVFFAGEFDAVADAIDSVSNKLDLIVSAHQRGVGIVSALGMGNKTDPAQIRTGDVMQTTDCPLARAVRKGLRQRGIERHRVVWSAERTVPSPVVASVSWVPSVAGLFLASEIIRQIVPELA